METAKFRFTDELTCAVEFDAQISTHEVFASSLEISLNEFIRLYPGKQAALHMNHADRWMPINSDCGNNTIVARTADVHLWCTRMSREILNAWTDIVNYSDRIDSLLGKALKSLDSPQK